MARASAVAAGVLVDPGNGRGGAERERRQKREGETRQEESGRREARDGDE